MKIALLTTIGSRVSPVFETTPDWLNIKKTETAASIVAKHYFNSKTEIEMANELMAENIELVICGAIPYYLEKILLKQGCEVISFISGEITEVLEAFQLNILDTDKFKMPGCQKRKHRGKNIFQTAVVIDKYTSIHLNTKRKIDMKNLKMRQRISNGSNQAGQRLRAGLLRSCDPLVGKKELMDEVKPNIQEQEIGNRQVRQRGNANCFQNTLANNTPRGNCENRQMRNQQEQEIQMGNRQGQARQARDVQDLQTRKGNGQGRQIRDDLVLQTRNGQGRGQKVKNGQGQNNGQGRGMGNCQGRRS